MTLEQYIKDNANEFGPQGSEFIIKVEDYFESIEGMVVCGNIRPLNRDGQTLEWVGINENLMLLPTDEEVEVMPKPNIDWEAMWKRIQAQLNAKLN